VGSYLDPSTGRIAVGTLTAARHTLGDSGAGERAGKAVWNISTRLDTATTLKNPDARQALDLSVHRWVFDRHTNEATTGHGGDTGLGANAYLKYPFDAGKRSYRLWDSTAGRTFTTHYTGTHRLFGHTLNEYTMSTDGWVRIGTRTVPGSVVGQPRKKLVDAEEWYRNPEQVNWVDSRTGTPVGGHSHQTVALRAPGSSKNHVILDVELRSTPASMKKLVDFASAKAAGLDLLSGPVPYGLTVLGAVGAVAGVALLRRRETPPVPGAEPLPAAAAAGGPR
jgi:Porin PorA